MNKAEELYHKIIEDYDERNYMSEKDGIKLIQLYADEQSRENIKIECRDHHTVILTNPKGDTFTFNPQEHEGLADFLHF